MSKNKKIQPTGNPLDLDDDQHCSVVLTTDTMKVKVEGKFRQRERKLFVLLIHSVWDELGTKSEYKVEADKIKRVFREVAGVKGFNNWLWEYLENLADIKITFEDARYRGVTRLLSKVIADKDTGSITFEIPKEVERGIKSPTQYARLDTYFLVGLKGKYSVSLYQLLESKINLNKLKPHKKPNEEDRFFEIPVSELRDWLGLGEQYKRWIDFKRFALVPAIEEINSNPLASTFTVRTEEVRGSRRKIKAIKFFLTKTPERLRLENSIQVTKEAKRAARESFLIPPFRGTEVYAEARKYAKGLDIYQLENEWREFAKNKDEKIEYPEKAFIGFVKKRAEKQSNSRFFGSLLSRISGNE